MARPKKINLEYFPMDVNILQDIKVRKLMRYHGGGEAFSIYITFLCLIYSNGYYLNFDDEMYFIVAEEVMSTEDKVKTVVEYCLEIGLFDKNMYDKFHILTSKAIQTRFKNVSERRSSGISPEYNLTDIPAAGKNNEKAEKTGVSESKTPVSATETKVIATKTPENTTKIPQSKVKESKYIDSSLRSESPSSSPTTVNDEQINFLAFQEFFNRTMQQHGAQIPTITQISMKRRQALTARAREHGKDALRTAVINAATAPFLNGASDKPFVANFDWIFRPTNFVKVLEGNYNHEITNPNTAYHATENNNGYRTSEDLRQGAARIIAQMSAEAKQPEEKLPVV